MNILGFMGWASHDPAACVIKTEQEGGFKFCTIAEERLNRVKYSYYFPLRSIKYCFDALGIRSLEEIDLVINDWSQNRYSFCSNNSYRRLEFDYIRKNLKIDSSKIKLIPSHHLAHAYSAFIPSGFDEAAILIVDAIGSGLQGTSIYHGKGLDIKFIESSGSFSIGKLYDAVTRKVLNFGIGEDGKTMGLAAFGEKHLNTPAVLNIKGRYEGTSIDYSNFMRRIPDNGINNSEIKKCSDKKQLYESYFSKVAFEVQDEAEMAMLHLAKYAKEKTGCKNLCIAGGVGLNCVANEKIRTSGLFDKIFIQPASSDVGVSFGLALYGYYNYVEKATHRPVFQNAFMGQNYSDESIKKVLVEFDIPYKEINVDQVAKLIAEKNVVAWHTGGSEFGPRALGHRSILADPRHADMKDILNLKVKHRELYRPFAPSVLIEHASSYFELGEQGSPFMLLAPRVRPDKVDVIPAVVHVDGTGRVQTVSRESCPEYYDLIAAFHKVTGVPVVLNTSFNDDHEPIVETPLDSLLCFLKTNIDYLVFNSCLIIKKSEITNKANKIEVMNDYRKGKLKSSYKELLSLLVSSYSTDQLKEYLVVNQKLATYYKNFSAYEKLLSFLKCNKRINFIGDKYHHSLILQLKKEFFEEPKLEKTFLIDDYLSNIKHAVEKIDSVDNHYPVLVGFYNLTEELRTHFKDRGNIFFIYEAFQVHLTNIASNQERESLDLKGIEEYSCEYNLSQDFDQMFV